MRPYKIHDRWVDLDSIQEMGHCGALIVWWHCAFRDKQTEIFIHISDDDDKAIRAFVRPMFTADCNHDEISDIKEDLMRKKAGELVPVHFDPLFAAWSGR